jgi:DNA-binding beta-propeller fold protein YncE
VAALALLAGCAGCGQEAAQPTPGKALYPATGLVLLGLSSGAVRAATPVGSDPVAVIVSDDGGTAYLADSSPGDVYAVRLPGLSVAWRQHVGGEPFGLLLHGGHLYVSLFDGASVVELDPATGAPQRTHPVTGSPAVMTVDAKGDVVVACRLGTVDGLDGSSVAAGRGFAVTAVGGTLWTADYVRSELVPVDDGRAVSLPLPLNPFWLAPGSGGSLLIAAEGAAEDSDPGGVFSYAPMQGTFETLARPRDPDQVLQSGSTVFVAAHGDREVLSLSGGTAAPWARGAAAVGLAADPALNLLVVVVNAHE